jgi:hypothetical protein
MLTEAAIAQTAARLIHCAVLVSQGFSTSASAQVDSASFCGQLSEPEA